MVAVFQPLERYPNCKYVVKNPATWNPAATSAADLLGCLSITVNDRALCSSGTNAGIWKATSATAFTLDSDFVPMRGWTVLCTDAPGASTYLQTAADQAATGAFSVTATTPVDDMGSLLRAGNITSFWDFSTRSGLTYSSPTGVDPVVNNATGKSGFATALVNDLSGLARATTLTESGTGARYIGPVATNTIGPGWVRTKFSYLPGVQYPSRRYMFRPHNTGGTQIQFLFLPSAAEIQYPDSATGYIAYKLADAGYNNGFEFHLRGDGWIDATYEANLQGGGSYGTYLWLIDTNTKSNPPLSGVTMTLGTISYEQDRVSAATPVLGDGDAELHQPTWLAQPVWAPDIWLDGKGCLVEGYGNSCGLTGAIPSCTTLSEAMVISCRDLRPSAAREVLVFSGSTSRLALRIETTGVWGITRTDDAGASASLVTTQPVSELPVCVQLIVGASSTTLYVDGLLCGTLATSTTATFTAQTLWSGNARTIVRNKAQLIGGAWSSAVRQDTCDRLRKRASLPDVWSVTIRTGQSNSTATVGNTGRMPSNGLFSRPGSAICCTDYGYANSVWSETLDVAGASVSGGGRLGYALEANRNGDYAIVINCSRGGVGIDDWLSGGAMYTYLPQQADAALATLGTPLYSVDYLNFVQGESDTGSWWVSQDHYLAGLQSFVGAMRTKYNPKLFATLFRLNNWLLTGYTEAAHTAGVQAAQDAFAASVANVAVARLDGGARLDWNIHYQLGQHIEIGRAEYRASRGLLPAAQPVDADYPQRGTWGTGIYWDAEHGNTFTPDSNGGGNITAINGREGAVLTLSGTPLMLPQSAGSHSPTGRRMMKTNSAQYASETNARWNAYGGSNTPLIAFVQFWPDTLSGNQQLLMLEDPASGNVPLSLALSGTTLTFSRANGVGGSTAVTKTVTAAALYTAVLVLTSAGVPYIIDSTYLDTNGLVGGPADSSGSMTCTMFIFSLNPGSGVESSLSYRRFGIKTPATSDAFGEAMQLFTMLTALG